MNTNYHTDLYYEDAYEVITNRPDKNVLVYIQNSAFQTVKADRNDVLDILSEDLNEDKVSITELENDLVVEFLN